MKSIIALSCILVVASAVPNSYYYKSRYPAQQKKYGYRVSSPVQSAVAPVAPVAAPVVKAAPVAVPVDSDFGLDEFDLDGFGLESLSKLASMDFSSLASLMDFSSLASLTSSLTSLKAFLPSISMDQAGTYLAKASKKLDDLNNGLPSVLANIDPAIKHDIGKVNVIIAEVCNKITAEASSPSTLSYYSPEGIQASCRAINNFANQLVLGLDDPSIVQSYVAKVQNLTKMLQAQAKIYNNFFE